jgi:hypothetical protein
MYERCELERLGMRVIGVTDARGVKPYNRCSTTIFLEGRSTAFFLFIPLHKPFRMVDWFWFYFLEFILVGKALYTRKECSHMLHKVVYR